jgi:hypothetical protein
MILKNREGNGIACYELYSNHLQIKSSLRLFLEYTLCFNNGEKSYRIFKDAPRVSGGVNLGYT